MVIGAVAFLMSIIALIILTTLLLYKTLQVYKQADKDPILIEMITKSSVLSFISIFLTLLTGLSFAANPDSHSIHIQFFAKFISIFDISSNFWCIMLSYSEYNDRYSKLCGYCDSKCKTCWYKIAEKESKGFADKKRMEVNEAQSTKVDNTK